MVCWIDELLAANQRMVCWIDELLAANQRMVCWIDEYKVRWVPGGPIYNLTPCKNFNSSLSIISAI